VAVVTPVFLDTTVLLGGCIDFGRSSMGAQQILDEVADRFSITSSNSAGPEFGPEKAQTKPRTSADGRGRR
jgi:hypothetical protein